MKALIIAGSFLLLSCGGPAWQGEGVISSKHYEASETTCSPGVLVDKVYVPGSCSTEPEHYVLTLHENNHKHNVWVKESEYSVCNVGQNFDTFTRICKVR